MNTNKENDAPLHENQSSTIFSSRIPIGETKLSKFLIYSKPLSSVRDPRRSPILSHSPFSARPRNPNLTKTPPRSPLSLRKNANYRKNSNDNHFFDNDKYNHDIDNIDNQNFTKVRNRQDKQGLIANFQVRMKPNEENGKSRLKSKRQGKKLKKNSNSSFTKNKNVSSQKSRFIIPAYAFKNAKTGLLEISELNPPSPSIVAPQKTSPKNLNKSHTSKNDSKNVDAIENLSKLKDKPHSKRPALFPIAINGGAVGVYTHPSGFGMNTNTASTSIKENNNSTSPRNMTITYNNNVNLQTIASRRAPMNSYMAFPSKIRDSEEYSKYVDILHDDHQNDEENQNLNTRNDYNCDSDAARSMIKVGHKRLSSNIISTSNNEEDSDDPWKEWERIHNKMTNLADSANQRKKRKYNHSLQNCNSLRENSDRKKSFIKEKCNGEEDECSVNCNDEKLLSFETCEINQLFNNQNNNVTTGRISSVYNQDNFDFALVLVRNSVYEFWAKHLDFRDEHYLEEYDYSKHRLIAANSTTLDEKDSLTIQQNIIQSSSISKLDSRLSSSKEQKNDCEEINNKKNNSAPNDTTLFFTPQRFKSTNSLNFCDSVSIHSVTTIPKSGVDSSGRRIFSQRKSLFERAMDQVTPPRSIALNKNVHCSSGNISTTKGGTMLSHSDNGVQKRKQNFTTTARRRWGEIANATITSPTPTIFESIEDVSSTGEQSEPTRNLMSPPINSIYEMGISFRTTSSAQTNTKKSTVFLGSASATKQNRILQDKDDEFSDDECHFPSQVIPRGIAARSNGMQTFLQALHRGIVLRKHVANGEAEFVTIFSKDGGDTISYQYIPPEEARVALLEQRVRFNRKRKNLSRLKSIDYDDRWNLNAFVNKTNPYDDHQYEQQCNDNRNINETHRSGSGSNIPAQTNLPNHIIAQHQSKLTTSTIFSRISEISTKFTHSGHIHAKDIVAVHPARHEDPFKNTSYNNSDAESFGTWALRQSKTEYCKSLSFSLVLPQKRIRDSMSDFFYSLKQKATGNFNRIERCNSEKWYLGQGSLSSFRTLDLEAATEGEYWTIFRGFLLLHRDAVSGRFAAERASGFSSHYNRKEDEERRQAQTTDNSWSSCHEDLHLISWKDFLFPWRKRIENQNPVMPPPSDYFLGFKSAGTQIWSRLRQAGLETQRIYAIDKKRVMIKIRCPPERLQDVAEVLKIKLKTTDGSYLPFQESIAALFTCPNEYEKLSDHPSGATNLFRSSDRQNIIDFIIRSRIRDSGAELGERSNLGKHIEMRVPLHMHAKLESLYREWVTFWCTSNWIGKYTAKVSSYDGSKLTNRTILMEESHLNDQIPVIDENSIPSSLSRFIFGSFSQPLDSIQEYFGEGVAFYFAWLQHCSYHLIFLSIVGFIVSICQIVSGEWDHPLRPYFSVVVMLWGLFVMITWRRRSNFLAHKWGTLNYEEEETTRPQFKGDYRRCEITQEWVVFYPSWKRWLKYCVSFPLTLAFTILSTIGILMVHANRDILLARYFEKRTSLENGIYSDESTFALDLSISSIGKKAPLTAVNLSEEVLRDPTFWTIVVGFPSILGFCYPLLNFILMKVSVMLNDFENYRTETEYRNHLVLKVFSFRFVCYFSSLYYYSFLLIEDTKQAKENSIFRVATSLIIYLTVAHWWNIFVVIYAPLIIHRWKLHRERTRLRDELRSLDQMNNETKKDELHVDIQNVNETSSSRDEIFQKNIANRRVLIEHAQDSVWEEIMLPHHNSFYDYVLATIQFGYVTCFSVVLPFTPLLCLINNLVSMRLDAYKLCRGRRRPLVTKAGGIGIWEHVLHIVTVISILTNCSLMALTSNLGKSIKEHIGDVGLFFVVVSWEHVMLFIKYAIQSAVPTMPKSVKHDLIREKYKLAQKNRLNMREKKERRSECCNNASKTNASIVENKTRTGVEKKNNSPKRIPKSTMSTQTEVQKSDESNNIDSETINTKQKHDAYQVPRRGVKEMVEEINTMISSKTPRSPIRSWKRKKKQKSKLSPKEKSKNPLVISTAIVGGSPAQTLRRRLSSIDRSTEMSQRRILSPIAQPIPFNLAPSNHSAAKSSNSTPYIPRDNKQAFFTPYTQRFDTNASIDHNQKTQDTKEYFSLHHDEEEFLNDFGSTQSSLFGENIDENDDKYDVNDDIIADLDALPISKNKDKHLFYEISSYDFDPEKENQDGQFSPEKIEDRLSCLEKGHIGKWVEGKRRRRQKK